VLTRPLGLGELLPKELGRVHLDHDPGVEVAAVVEVEVRVALPSKAAKAIPVKVKPSLGVLSLMTVADVC